MLSLVKEAIAAQVDLKDQFAFGGLNSFGEGLSYLVKPGFSIAATAVLIYFVLGAVRHVFSGGDKEAVAKARAMMTHGFIAFILLILMFLFIEVLPSWIGLGTFQLIKR